SMSHTLLAGRHHFAHRCAVVVEGREDALHVLRQAAGRERLPNLFRGVVARQFAPQTALQGYGQSLLAQGYSLRSEPRSYREALQAVAELYCQGYAFEWEALYGATPPRRRSLPSYPFARQRYWAPSGTVSTTAAAAVLHPLVHRNTSDLSGPRFTTVLTGEEFYLADHVVAGQRVLPGVAHLEMARAAVALVADVPVGSGIHLSEVAWLRPLLVEGGPVEVRIGLHPEANGAIGYEIHGESDGARVVWSQGVASVVPLAAAPLLDVASMRERCTEVRSAEQVYRSFAAMGLAYGPGHRAVSELAVGPETAVARLVLPAEVPAEGFVLHPSLMDGALQASLGFGREAGSRPSLPFAVEAMEVFGACTASMWAVARPSGSSARALDIELCDEGGSVRVRMRGFSAREQSDAVSASPAEAEAVPASGGDLLLAPVWDAEAAPSPSSPVVPGPGERVAVVGGTAEQVAAVHRLCPQAVAVQAMAVDGAALSAELSAAGELAHVVWILPEGAGIELGDAAMISAQSTGVVFGFRLVKALLSRGYGERPLGLTVVTTQTQAVRRGEVVRPAHASVRGLVGSLAKEYPNWRVRLADMQADLEADAAWPWAELLALPADAEGEGWAWRRGQWYRQRLLPVAAVVEDRGLYRAGGVYVVIGGAGGLGEVWSEAVIRSHQARIVWIGRRAKDASIEARLDRLAGLGGPAPEYLAADAGDAKALKQAVAAIKRRHGAIHGVVHAAIVLADRSLANMDEARFCASLAAKVDVSVGLAQAFADEALDFVLFFSSLQSFTKAAGQSNYAAGCTFKDAFAQALDQAWPCAVKVMNWGYWGSIGVVATAEYRERLARTGIGSIEPAAGLKALDKLMAAPLHQLAFVTTTKPWNSTDENIR
ncbi:MAG TPA: SDR family oxidoreductase, partial [Bradyrhizobium sp.]|nr:SDR family oxidoreductase [Bradyrhizobium sp.]